MTVRWTLAWNDAGKQWIAGSEVPPFPFPIQAIPCGARSGCREPLVAISTLTPNAWIQSLGTLNTIVLAGFS